MSRKRIDVDTDNVVREYLSGRSAGDIAKQFGVDPSLIYTRLQGAGVQRRRPLPPRPGRHRPDLPDGEIVRLYQSGLSEKAVAARFGVGRAAIRLRLIAAGITPRGRTEAETLKWSQMTSQQRMHQTQAAHTTSRGRRLSWEHQLQIAQTRQRLCLMEPNERRLQAMLLARGIETIPQQAIGPYNCDLGAHPVAVEIWGGHWHWSGRHLRRTPERFRYLMDTGWHIIALHVTRTFPLTDLSADYVATFIELARGDPTVRREYRVIRRAGELLAAGCVDDKEITIKPALSYGRDLTTGRYFSKPR